MSVLKVVGKLRRSKLFITFLFILTIYFCFVTLTGSPESVTVVNNSLSAQQLQNQRQQRKQQQPNNKGSLANPNNNLKALDDAETENIFKEPDVPSLITFDFHDIVNYIKSFFQDQETALRSVLTSYATRLKSSQQPAERTIINKNSEIEIDTFNYRDYDVVVPEIYLNKYKNDEALPLVASYDIRFTVAVYLNHIRHKLENLNQNRENGKPSFDIELPFHWYDWVDITALNKYILYNNDPYIAKEDKAKYNCKHISTNFVKNFGDHGEDPSDDPNMKKPFEIQYDPGTFCRDLDKVTDLATDYEQNLNSSINFNVFKWTRKSSIRAKMLQSRSYLYAGAPTPVSVIFLVDQNFVSQKEKSGETKSGKAKSGKAKRAAIEDVGTIKDLNKDKRVNNIIAYEFPITQGNTVGHGKKLLENYDSMVKEYLDDLQTSQEEKINPLQALQKLVEAFPLDKFDEDPEENEHEIFVDNEDLTMTISTNAFEYNPEEAIAEYAAKFKGQSTTTGKSPRSNLKLKKEKSHSDSLQFSIKKNPAEIKKHFHEVPIAPSSDNEDTKLNKAGGHYDWRFFNGIIESELETRRTLHHLLRSFLKFTYAKNIQTWLAHGSLLSWYWNGMNFPWDYDIDVQMPIKDLQKFCKLYNNTLVVENINDGLGKYFVDCGAYLTHRTKEYGKNNIDARFIDVDKGIYIDITGLALTDEQLPKKYQNLRKRDAPDIVNDGGVIRQEGKRYPFTIEDINYEDEEQIVENDETQSEDEGSNGTLSALFSRDAAPAVIKPVPIRPARIVKTYQDGLTPQQRYAKNARLQVYNCKNKHFVFYRQLSPLKLTLIEGTKGFVPLNFKQILKDEYHSSSLLGQYFAKHFFLKKLRLWIPAATFKAFFKKQIKEQGNMHYRKSLSKNLHAIDNDISDILKFLEFDETVLRSYYLHQRITKQHEQEMELLNDGQLTKELLLSNIEFKPLLKDHFLHIKNDVEGANGDGSSYGTNMYDSVKGTLQMDQMTGDEDETSDNGGGGVDAGAAGSVDAAPAGDNAINDGSRDEGNSAEGEEAIAAGGDEGTIFEFGAIGDRAGTEEEQEAAAAVAAAKDANDA